MKLFGREPALWISFAASLLLLLGTLGFRWLDGDQAILIVTALNALAAAATAYAVRPISPAIFTYAAGAIVSVFAAYGLKVTPDQLAMLNAVVVMGLGLLTRGQVSPMDTTISRAGGAVNKPVVQTVPEG